ncbi:MAG: hypothetical protein JO199_10635, partial [Candidatus Eremiobacteraeota bacterium]|nr:hypothetical protein [Candidatus Eremiobacteraeota bacterium]
VDSRDRIWVCSGSSVLVFAAGVNGNVSPIFTLGGNQTQLSFANVSLTFDPSSTLDVVNSQSVGGTSSIVEFTGLDGNLPSNGNIAPARVLTGTATQLTGTFGIAAR